MYSRELIKQIHTELAAVSPYATVLLGGSYLYNEACEESDVDFYFVSRLSDILNPGIRHRIESVKDKFFTVNVQVSLIPRLFFKRGWYLVYGRDLLNKNVQSPLNKKIVVRNAFKLGYFHLLKSRLAVSTQEAQHSLTKAAQQAGAVEILIKNIYTFSPLFSAKAILETSKNNAIHELLGAKLHKKQMSEDELGNLSVEIEKLLKSMYEAASHEFGFSMLNYLVYNSKFLLRGNTEFVWSNPDQKIMQIFLDEIQHTESLKKLYLYMKQVVFPVIIV